MNKARIRYLYIFKIILGLEGNIKVTFKAFDFVFMPYDCEYAGVL